MNQDHGHRDRIVSCAHNIGPSLERVQYPISYSNTLMAQSLPRPPEVLVWAAKTRMCYFDIGFIGLKDTCGVISHDFPIFRASKDLKRNAHVEIQDCGVSLIE